MEYQKDYSLLRPFDLEAAKRGEKICNKDGKTREYAAGPDKNDWIAVFDNGNLTFDKQAYYRMSPLAWVEGKPVYKGDVLYYKSDKESAIVTNGDEYFLSVKTNDCGICTECIDDLTWQKPKTKREGWVNVYKSCDRFVAHVSHAFDTKENAIKHVAEDVIDCVKITWEE